MHWPSWKDPLRFVDDLAGPPQEDIEMIMGGNMTKMFKFANPVPA